MRIIISIVALVFLSAFVISTFAEAPTTAPVVPPTASSDGPWIATLPSGIKVELFGVSRHPVDESGWWKPDGTVITDAPPAGLMTEKEYRSSGAEGVKLYKIFIRYHTPDQMQRVLSPQAEAEDAHYVRRPIGKDVFSSEIVLTQPADRTVAAVRINMGMDGIERLIDTPAPQQKADFAVADSNDAKLTFQPEAGEEGRYAVTIDCPTSLLAHNFIRPVAIVKGKEFTRMKAATRENSSDGVTRLRYTMDIEPGQVQRFRLEAFRPQEYARFTNVCLDPSAPTSPTAEGRKGDRLVKGIKKR